MDESIHKFDTPMKGITYRQYLTAIYTGRVELIRELEEILGKNRTHEIIERYYTQGSIESCKKLVEAQENPIETLDDLRNLFQTLKETEFSQNTQTDIFIESEPGTFQFCTKECLWATVFRDLDAGDLGQLILCNGDFATAEVFHPNLRLKRNKTLMQGDDCCDFTYTFGD